MNITKAELRELKGILDDLQRADRMMQTPDMYLATTRYVFQDDKNPIGSAYVIVNEELSQPNNHSVIQPRVIGLLTKEVGSDFVGLKRGTSRLDQLLTKLRERELKTKTGVTYTDDTLMESTVNHTVYTLEDFRQACEDGDFIDYDGTGYVGDETRHTRIEAIPSVYRRAIPEKHLNDYSHVHWYNK